MVVNLSNDNLSMENSSPRSENDFQPFPEVQAAKIKSPLTCEAKLETIDLDASTSSEKSTEDTSLEVITNSMLEAQTEADFEAQIVLEKDEDSGETSAPTLLQAGISQEGPADELAFLIRPQDSESRTAQLDLLLTKAEQFSAFIYGCQDEAQQRLSAAQCCAEEDDFKDEDSEVDENTSPRTLKRKAGTSKGGKRKGAASKKTKSSDEAKTEMADAGKRMTDARAKERPAFQQPQTMIGGKLKEYQLEGLRWLASLFENGLSGILADEMGLGKTIQVISFLAYLTEKKVSGPFLIASPLATLPNWLNEFRKWVPSMPVVLYHGNKEERALLRRTKLRPADQRKPEFPVILTSYEICIIDRPLLQHYFFKYMVIDEGQRIKNRNCRLVRELKTLNSESRLLLSGTPIQNTLEELWTLLNFVNPSIFDDLSVFQSWFGFRNIGRETQVSDIVEGEEHQRIVTKLHEILRPFLLRRLKKDVILNIPPKQEIVIYAPMTQLQMDYCTAIQDDTLRDVLQQFGFEGAKNQSQISQMMNLRKAANHPFLFGEPKNNFGEYIGVANPMLMVHASGKMALLDRMFLKLKADGHKVLLFSQMTKMLNIIEDYLQFRGWEYCRIDGSVGVFDRQRMIDSFNNDPNIFCFLLSTRAGGLGINLTAADTCVIFDSDWNPHQDSQAQDRCHRIGQTKPVAVYRLVTANSIEIEMMEKAISKKKLERMAISGGDFRQPGRRTGAALSTSALQRLLEDDISSLQRMAQKAEIEELNISDEEFDLFMNRERIFNGTLPEDGNMYSVVEVKDAFLVMA